MKRVYEQCGIASYNTSVVASLWWGVAPPKVELLLWFILLGRLNTKDGLCRLNILSAENNLCVFYNCAEETMSHLFFTCQFVWKAWTSCYQWWGMTWVMDCDPRINFESWAGVKCSRNQKKMWLSWFYAIYLVCVGYEKQGHISEQRGVLEVFHDGDHAQMETLECRLDGISAKSCDLICCC